MMIYQIIKIMGNNGHKFLLAFFIMFFSISFEIAQAIVAAPNLKDSGVVDRDLNGSIDPSVDYERFSGRVSDRSDKTRIFKIKVENNNVKFFRAGDLVLFKVNEHNETPYCKAYVRSVENFYFTIYVDQLKTCYPQEKYFRRGTVLQFYAKVLAVRVFEASKYREQLIERKKSFLQQLSGINHFIWSFDQERVKVAIEYDKEISRIQKQKQKALKDLVAKKHEKLILQQELKKQLYQLDDSLKFYRIERQEHLVDRWNNDHDQGLPFSQRPQIMRKP